MKIALRIGDVELTERLACGSAGEVWRGVHCAHEYPMAVKLLPQNSTLGAGTGADQSSSDALNAAELRREFEYDIQTIATLSHPRIVSVYDFVADPPVLAMELADGSCRALEAISSWATLRDLLLQMLDALEYIHSRQIIHCDIKPDNILRFSTPARHLGDTIRPVYKLTDFGIAHRLNQQKKPGEVRHENTYRGSPQYSPPEQILGDERAFGPWTDLYALGCMAYECACGTPPFGHANFMTLTMRHLDHRAEPLKPRFIVPVAFNDWLQHLLRKDPTHRYQSAAQAAQALREIRSMHAPTDPADALRPGSLT